MVRQGWTGAGGLGAGQAREKTGQGIRRWGTRIRLGLGGMVGGHTGIRRERAR
jgi:hypothetical protein